MTDKTITHNNIQIGDKETIDFPKHLYLDTIQKLAEANIQSSVTLRKITESLEQVNFIAKNIYGIYVEGDNQKEEDENE